MSPKGAPSWGHLYLTVSGGGQALTAALYPGSFDPLTNGHLDIATRAASLFDQVVIGVYDAPPKKLLFTTQERVDLWRQAVSHLPKVQVES